VLEIPIDAPESPRQPSPWPHFQNGLPPSNFFYVLIESVADPAVCARSECFAINSCEAMQKIKVKQPSGESFWHSGQSVSVLWECASIDMEVVASLWKGQKHADGAHVLDLTPRMPNTGQARCKVPQGLKPGDAYYVMVMSRCNKHILARSEFFAINVRQPLQELVHEVLGPERRSQW